MWQYQPYGKISSDLRNQEKPDVYGIHKFIAVPTKFIILYIYIFFAVQREVNLLVPELFFLILARLYIKCE